jgi:hypothetical protein
VLAGAAAFNGTDSSIMVPDSPSLDNTPAFTLSYRFKANTFNGAGLVAKRVSFNDNNSYGTFLTADGKLNIDIDSNNNRFTSTTGFERGAWYHIALVFDGSLAADQRAKLYVDGALDRTATETSASIPNYNSPLYVGILSAPTTAYFDGLIDDVRFQRRALTAADVAAISQETSRRAPAVTTGPPPAAITNTSVPLTGSVTVDSGPAATTTWSKINGPGNAFFANPASPVTSVSFDQPGTYLLKLTAANPNAEVSRTLTIEVAPNPAYFAGWQSLTWPGVTDPGIIGPDMDPDHDGIINLLEWALNLSATTPGTIPASLAKNSGLWTYTYTRRKTAPGEATFLVEWSGTLANDWTNSGIGVETPVSSTLQSETVKVALPAATNGRCFVRLRVTRP